MKNLARPLNVSLSLGRSRIGVKLGELGSVRLVDGGRLMLLYVVDM